ncbi:hypothetical protein K7X08_032064 [Anisodus acutangulus]|uniref:Uncharacterized protein n=1 Tax=Anisodus acutangulus TaxID=402998 RepID=A0A9Q1RMA3_9SOLA|nr:hypothetical protein K7X08_032064 [Anisodus acutangulus]
MSAILAASLIQVLVGLYFPISNSMSIVSKDSLLQIWIPGSEEGRTLSAMGSPHGIAYEEGSSSSHQLQLYREVSGKYGVAKEMITPFSQFSNQTKYLHYEIAKNCGIRGSKFLPVFVLSSRTQGPCIAVLELVTTRSDPDFGIEEH